MRIVDDITVEIVQKTRIIEVKDGPVIRTKNKRYDFQVVKLTTKWYEQSEPAVVVAHGKDEHGIGASRAFSLHHKKTPKWVKEALNGSDA